MRTVCAQWICLIHDSAEREFHRLSCSLCCCFFLYVNPFVRYGCFYRTRSIVRNRQLQCTRQYLAPKYPVRISVIGGVHYRRFHCAFQVEITYILCNCSQPLSMLDQILHIQRITCHSTKKMMGRDFSISLSLSSYDSFCSPHISLQGSHEHVRTQVETF